ncbi:MAG: protein kinase domain-containing protein, partial [Planctomycetota bacterium]
MRGKRMAFSTSPWNWWTGRAWRLSCGRRGPSPEARAVEISRQITRALSQAYRKNIIHRDIKPENILIDREGVAKLTDLGLAKFTGGEQRR